jgi:hypothetical protein
MPLPPYADRTLFFGRDQEAREIIIPVQLVPQPIILIVDLLFHCLTLPFIIIVFLALPPFCLLCFSGLRYPQYDDTQITAKVPSQELSDAMVKTLKGKLNKD